MIRIEVNDGIYFIIKYLSVWEDSVILKHSHSLDNNNGMCGLSGSNIILSLIKFAESQSQWQ